MEQPASTLERLRGVWRGEAATIQADWPEPEMTTSRREPAEEAAAVLLLPDGGFLRLPPRISHREAFALEGGWLRAPDQLEILTRRYDASGAWHSATHERLTRA